ncbi:unnamed protein product [Brachionus calyciflorus]|uniref:EGF-like domain-containing protein n=1 Tax=Brachionus calyciflorus TaxID=104777 RepID=A0A814E6G0_9BILA|nr:unnamed protein product [Brachionus calyciflorus]
MILFYFITLSFMFSAFQSKETQRNACVSNPCQNGGSCLLNPSDLNNYTCSCQSKYSGQNCSIRIKLEIKKHEAEIIRKLNIYFIAVSVIFGVLCCLFLYIYCSRFIHVAENSESKKRLNLDSSNNNKVNQVPYCFEGPCKLPENITKKSNEKTVDFGDFEKFRVNLN